MEGREGDHEAGTYSQEDQVGVACGDGEEEGRDRHGHGSLWSHSARMVERVN